MVVMVVTLRVVVTVPVVVLVVVPVMVTMTVLMVVPVAVIMRVTVPAIAARLRLERQPGAVHAQAELSTHAVEHVIVRVEHRAWQDLERHVPVAQVVRGASEKVRVVRRCA